MNEQVLYDRPLFPAQLNMAHPLTRGLVGCWVLNENDPTSMRAWDSSPYKNHGLVTGALGRHQGRKVDGIDDIIDVAVGTEITGLTTYAIEAWQKLTAVENGQVLLNFRPGDVYQIFTTMYSNATTGWAYLGLSYYRLFTTALDTAWHHIIFEVTGDDVTTAALYVDSVAQAIQSTTSTGSVSAKTGLRIGEGHAEWLNATLGELRIYNRLLTASEKQQLYLNPYDMFLR